VRNFREQCCDWGRIHRLDFRLVNGRSEFRTRRDDRGEQGGGARENRVHHE
jgi:hypothetical protein